MKKLYLDEHNHYIGLEFDNVVAFYVIKKPAIEYNSSSLYGYLTGFYREALVIIFKGTIGEKPPEVEFSFPSIGKQIYDDLVHYFQVKIDFQKDKCD
jgi:hypothetical protein